MSTSDIAEPTNAGPHPAAVFIGIGSIAVILGGSVSAATAPSPSYTASWAAAYIVLVAGAAQIALGLGQARLAARRPSGRMIAAQAIVFNAANIAVLLGTIVGSAVLTDVGGVLIIAAFVLFLLGVRGRNAAGGWMLYGYRILIGALIVTAPIGLVIAAVRTG